MIEPHYFWQHISYSIFWALQIGGLVLIIGSGCLEFSCYVMLDIMSLWAKTWQNQQNECAPSKDSDQPGHPPSLTRVFAVRMKKPWVISHPLSAQRRLWSDWADAQADLSLRWAHTHFVGFVMSWLLWLISHISLCGIFLLFSAFFLCFYLGSNV